jgi:hypothetical protein
MTFKSFLKEFHNIEPNQAKDAHEPTGESSSSVQNPIVVSEINSHLYRELNVDGFRVAQDGIQKVRKVLNSYGLDIPALYELDVEGDEITFDIQQFDNPDNTIYLYLLYYQSDVGNYDFYAQVGDHETINELVTEEPEED